MTALEGLSGAELVAVLESHARRNGVSINQYVKPLTCDPSTWLFQLRGAKNPKPQTIARIEALIDGRPLPDRAPGGPSLHISRDERVRLGIAPSSREIRELRSLNLHQSERAQVEQRLHISRLAHERRRPGETLFATTKRLQQELRA